MQSLLDIIKQKPWLVFGILMAAGTVCALIELQHPTAALFMAAGVLMMWQSGAARPAEQRDPGPEAGDGPVQSGA